MRWKQRGYNGKYPREIETWQHGEHVPEWLIRLAKVKFIDGEGNVTLEFRETSVGPELLESSGRNPLVKMREKSDFICLGDDHIFSLTEKQINLLYEQSRPSS